MSSAGKPAADVVDIEQAKRNAAVARARVQTTVGALKERVSPGNIVAGAKERVREKTDAIGSAAQRRPVAAGTVAGVAGLILFRKPVKRVLKRLFVRSEKSKARKLARQERKAVKRANRDAARAPEAVRTPPDDLIPHASVTNDAAPAKQE